MRRLFPCCFGGKDEFEDELPPPSLKENRIDAISNTPAPQPVAKKELDLNPFEQEDNVPQEMLEEKIPSYYNSSLCIELGSLGISFGFVDDSGSRTLPILAGSNRIPSAFNSNSQKIGKFAFSGKFCAIQTRFLESIYTKKTNGEQLIEFFELCFEKVKVWEELSPERLVISLPPCIDHFNDLQKQLRNFYPKVRIEFVHSTLGSLLSFTSRNSFQKQNLLVLQFGGGFFSYELFNFSNDLNQHESIQYESELFGSSCMIEWCMNYIYHQIVPHANENLNRENYPYYNLLFHKIENNFDLFDDQAQEVIYVDIGNYKLVKSMPGFTEDEEDEEEETEFTISMQEFNNYLSNRLLESILFKNVEKLVNHHKRIDKVILQGGMSKSPIFRKILSKILNNIMICESFDMINSPTEGIMVLAAQQVPSGQ